VSRLRPTLAYLIPVGNNPTGAVWSASRFEAVCARLAASGVSVIDDRVPVPLAPPEVRVPHLATRLGVDQVVTVGSLSKTAWAGLRTGWLVTSPRVATDVVAARIASELSPSVPSQVLARHLLPHLDDLAAEVRLRVAESEQAARGVLEGAGAGWELPPMRAGAWLWARLPAHDGASLAAAAERHDVLVTPGGVFSADARQADRIRISTVLPPEAVAEGARRLVAAWQSLGTGAPPRRTTPASLVF
jgi:DNA-binding transcriptional MocR family regulator